MKNNELENILDKVTDGIRAEQISDDLVSQSANRVWQRVSTEAGAPQMSANSAAAEIDRIEGCADFQSLIPAYLDGKLSEARSLLLVDHTHECIPCRRALKQAREKGAAPSRDVRRSVRAGRARTQTYSLRPVVLRWGIAAALVIGLGLIALPVLQRYVPLGSFDATVQAADGPLYLVSDSQTRQLKVGEKINRGEVIRTAKDGHATVRLGDGTTIEMKDRSEFSINRTLSGTTVQLGNGSVIVEAAKQNGHLYVATNDSLVSVTGTTFAVNAGTKGSRVSVIEGEVHLDRNGTDRVLRPGEQATTNAAIDTVPVKDEVSWSRNAARYTKVLESLAALRKDLNVVQMPDARHSTRLLDMMPANTVFYAALPNLGATIAESNRIIQERIQQNPELRDWFASQRGAHGPAMNEAVTTIKEFGDQLGDEIAISAGMNDQGQPTDPVVLAQLKNPGGFRAFVDSEVQKLSTNGKAPQIQWVDDPRQAVVSATTEKLYAWINGDMLVASPKLAGLQTIANGGSSFSTATFYSRIADVYRDGAGIVLAADLEKIIAHTRGLRRLAVGDSHEQALNQLGVFNMKSFVLDQKDTDGKTHTRAVLSYDPSDRGITTWLAQPAPMGSLDYISPDANLVAGFVIKNPTAVVDDLLAVISNVCPDLNKHLDELQRDHGLNVRNDFAAPLGGEYAFAIDGPILPTPSWKLVVQVNDPVHLQQTFEQVVNEINKQAAKEGKKGLEWDKSDSGGRTFYALRSKDFGGVEVNYVFANGYLIAGPTRALVDQALRFHDSGTTLVHSAKFTAGLPADGNVNFSALIYHNLAPLAKSVNDRIGTGNLPSGPQNALTMAATMEPTLAYAYAYGDRIEFAANTEGGPFGLSPATLLGMPNAFELHHILEQGLKK
ncbi:MAG TPA: FecR domain-containing protein [Pyrinomonadaceae bacterium]|nr:FecR domain-containing protein [Pyrinomonadaceae bacterium]